MLDPEKRARKRAQDNASAAKRREAKAAYDRAYCERNRERKRDVQRAYYEARRSERPWVSYYAANPRIRLMGERVAINALPDELQPIALLIQETRREIRAKERSA
jgi:hypothetical protein